MLVYGKNVVNEILNSKTKIGRNNSVFGRVVSYFFDN